MPDSRPLTVLQFLLSLLAAFLFFTLSAGLFLLGISGWLADPAGSEAANMPAIFMWATALSVIGLLVLPSSLFALLQWTGHAHQGLKPKQRLSVNKLILVLLVIGFPTSLALGWAVSQHTWASVILLPPTHVLAVGIPILWLGMIGLRGLHIGSPQRMWGVLAAGLVLGPGISITLEILAGIFILIIGVAILSTNPETVALLENIVVLMQQTTDPNQMLAYLQPLLTNPWVIGSVMVMIAVVTPLIEETFKPIGVYFLLHRRLSPAEGFAAGLINGLGFALFESLLVASGTQDWLGMVLLRAPTAALHGFTTALVGYGLASAASQKRYFRLAGTFAAAVALHGIWNGLTLVYAGYTLQSELPLAGFPALGFSQVIPLILVALTGLTFLGIVLLNRRLIPPVVYTGS